MSPLLILGAAAGAGAAELDGLVFAQSPLIVRGTRLLPEPAQVRSGRWSSSCSGSGPPPGSTTTAKRAEQHPVRALELGRLLHRRARLRAALGDPDLPDRPDPAPAGVLRAAVHLRLRPEPDRARRLQGADALPPGRGHERADGEDGHAGRCSTGATRAATRRDRRSSSSARARSGQGRPDAGVAGRGVAVVHVGQGAGLRRRAPAGDRHPPRADQRAALGPLPDRRHPPRRRAVRPPDRRRRDQRLQGPRGARHLREAEAAGRLVRRQARRPRARVPRGDLGLEVGREAGDANPRQRRRGRRSSRTSGCGPSWRPRSAAWSPSRTACSSAAGRPGRARRPRSTPASARSTGSRRTSSPSRTRSNTTSTTSPRWRSTPRAARPSPAACGRSSARTPTSS